MNTIKQWLRSRLCPPGATPPVQERAESAISQLREVNQQVKAFRAAKTSRATGNMAADMVRGVYRPRPHGETN